MGGGALNCPADIKATIILIWEPISSFTLPSHPKHAWCFFVLLVFLLLVSFFFPFFGLGRGGLQMSMP